MITFWSRHDSKWPPQIADLKNHKNDSYSDSFTVFDLILGVIAAETDSNNLRLNKSFVQDHAVCYLEATLSVNKIPHESLNGFQSNF